MFLLFLPSSPSVEIPRLGPSQQKKNAIAQVPAAFTRSFASQSNIDSQNPRAGVPSGHLNRSYNQSQHRVDLCGGACELSPPRNFISFGPNPSSNSDATCHSNIHLLTFYACTVPNDFNGSYKSYYQPFAASIWISTGSRQTWYFVGWKT